MQKLDAQLQSWLHFFTFFTLHIFCERWFVANQPAVWVWGGRAGGHENTPDNKHIFGWPEKGGRKPALSTFSACFGGFSFIVYCFFSYLFPSIPPFSSIFPLFATIFLRFFPTFFLSFLHLPSLSALLPSIFPLLLTIVLQFLSLHSSLHTLHSLHSLHSTLYTEAQTICSYNHSSVSLLIPLQTLLFRTPTNAALRWASEFLHFPTFSTCFGGFSFIVYCFFPTFFLAFLQFPPFSPCFQRFSFVFFSTFFVSFLHLPSFSVVFFLLFSWHSSMFLHFPPFPPVFNDFPSFFSALFLSCLNFPPFPPVFNDLPSFSVVFFLLFS